VNAKDLFNFFSQSFTACFSYFSFASTVLIARTSKNLLTIAKAIEVAAIQVTFSLFIKADVKPEIIAINKLIKNRC